MDECSVLFRSASGEELRFSTTADDPNYLITIESITTKLGTGFDTAVMSLHRDPFERFDDLGLLIECIITDSEGFVLHEGHITGLPPEAGKIQVNSTGKFSILKDRSGFSMVYRDADPSHWGDMPLAEKVRLGAGSIDFASIGWSVDQGALVCALPNQALGSQCSGQAWYTAPPGCLIGSTEYAGTNTNVPAGYATAQVRYPAVGDYLDGTDETDAATLDGTEYTSTASTARRYVVMQMYTNGSATTPTAGANRRFTTIAVIGDHGLTSITASEVIKHMIDTYAPGLTYDDESITDHPYEIGQLMFDGVDGSDVIAKVNSFANWDFNVWEGGKCWYGPQPDLNAPDFILDQDDGDVLDPDGQSISDDHPVNGVECFYTDVLTDRAERVGPDDDTRLADTSDENPCNKENRDRYGKLDISFPCNEDDAIQIGSVWLAEHLIPSRSGSGKAIGTIQSAGERVPARRIRAGQVVRYRHESIGRQVYETTYQPSNGEVTLKYDDGAATLTAMLERIGIALILAGGK